MKQWIATHLVVLAFGCTTATLHANEVILLPEAVVLASQVRIADIAELRGFDADARDTVARLVLAVDLSSDAALRITQDMVRQVLTDTSINRAQLILKGAAACDVRRVVVGSEEPVDRVPQGVVEEVSGRTLREVVVALIGAQLGVPDAVPVVRFGHADAALLNLQEPRFQFSVRQTSGRRLGMIGLEVVVTDADDPPRRFSLMVQVSAQRSVLVAGRAINLGATIQPSDLHTVKMAFSKLHATGVSDAAAVLGQRARRFIPAGEMINLRDLEPIPLVQRGELVEVRSQVGWVTITSAAKASREGSFGETIELRSGPRGSLRLSGVIRGPGRVHVGGRAQPASGMRIADRSQR